MKAIVVAFLSLGMVEACSFIHAEEPMGPPVQTIEMEQGELKVLFRDNTESPKVLSGLDSLFSTRHAPDYDAFDPDAKGASAGLNFEHIISGHRNPNNKF